MQGDTSFGWVYNFSDSVFMPHPVYCAFATKLAQPVNCNAPL